MNTLNNLLNNFNKIISEISEKNSPDILFQDDNIEQIILFLRITENIIYAVGYGAV